MMKPRIESLGGRLPCATRGWILTLALLTGVMPAQAAEPLPAVKPVTQKIDFGREIQPIFAKRCFHCHGPDKSEAGLRLNKRALAMGKLESGETPIVPGDVAKSELLRRISAHDENERMPPKGKPLSAEQVELLRRWVEQGAVWEEHWAFQPPHAVAPPEVKNKTWVRNPVDAFILAGLEKNNLAPAAPADKIALLRRASYDLTGLPPSTDEVAAFLADSSPQAYEKVIDRLLASPRYGERWGRHWLDLVRFAETNSFERDGKKPHAWRYRDYVIRALNADKPYDQFILEQLAGDELPTVTSDSIIATGYYRLGLWDDEPADRALAKFDGLDDIVATTSQVFLGLTTNCARCHDHKIDPIPQKDYYSMVAFFHGVAPMENGGPRIEIPLFENEAAKLAYQQRQQELEEKRKAARAEAVAVEDAFKIIYVKLTDGKDAKLNPVELIRKHGPKLLGDELYKKYHALHEKREQLNRETIPADYALAVTENGSQAPDTFVLGRGNPQSPGEKVAPGFPSILDSARPVIPVPPPGAKTSGRRLVLAQWIASPENGMTSRVMVNRIWQHHFGRGIVRSPNNFGQLGDRPTHPELLDWLSAEFVKQGWRLKAMHKLIMLSNTYCMSSQANTAALAADPVNNHFWRYDMRRLSGEELRDSIFAVNGRLNLKMFGPGIYPDISAEVLAGQSQPGNGWGKTPPEEQARRSVYIHVKRSLITPILADFDFADTDSSCAARFTTTQPTQALAMLNGEFLQTQAGELANRLRREAGDDPAAQVKLALRLALSREPDAKTVDRGLALMKSLEQKHRIDSKLSLNYYCLLVLNLNEFVYLD